MHRLMAVLALLTTSGASNAVTLEVPAAIKAEPGQWVEVRAKTDGKSVRWVRLDKGLHEFPPGRLKDDHATIVMANRAGPYRLMAVAAGADGSISEPAICIVTVQGDGQQPPPAAPPPAPSGPNPAAATVRLETAQGRCTATIIGPRRADGRWDVLSAGHCLDAKGGRVTIVLGSGQRLPVTVQAVDRAKDLTWLLTGADAGELPFARLASETPEKGTAVWHCGFGTDKPGNTEKGVVAVSQDGTGFLWCMLSVSPGDSGSGIFAEASGELVGVVSGTTGLARFALMRAGGVTNALRLRPAGLQDGLPVPMPFVPFARSEGTTGEAMPAEETRYGGYYRIGD